MRDKIHARWFPISAVLTVAFLVLLILSSVIYFFILGKGNAQSKTNPGGSSPTATATPALTPSSTPQPLFYDDFSGPNKGWYLNNAAGYVRLMLNDSLMLSNTNHDVLIESLPTERTFNNFMLTVVFTIVQAGNNDSVGVYVRGDANLDHDYRVDIYGNRSYSISKEYLDMQKDQQSVFLAGPTQTTHINPIGQQNVLTVIMDGPAMTLRINGSVVASITDSDYTEGQIALFVQGSQASNQVTASFKSVTVNPLPVQPPAQGMVTPQKTARQTERRCGPRQVVSAPSPGSQQQTPAPGTPGA